MKVLVITDIHSNLAALRAVLEAAAPFDKVWCTGDIVGYGPEPNECVEMLAGLPLRATAGNHDLGALGKLPLQVFNPAARAALRWTADALTRESIQFLESLPRTLDGRYAIMPRQPARAGLGIPVLTFSGRKQLPGVCSATVPRGTYSPAGGIPQGWRGSVRAGALGSAGSDH